MPMSINPASDIVLDVIKAAEPAASRKAVEKLASLAGARGASAADAFEHTLRRSALNFSARLHLGAAAPANFVPNFQKPDARANAYNGLEQRVLRPIRAVRLRNSRRRLAFNARRPIGRRTSKGCRARHC